MDAGLRETSAAAGEGAPPAAARASIMRSKRSNAPLNPRIIPFDRCADRLARGVRGAAIGGMLALANVGALADPPRPTFHVRVEGDLDSSRLATEFADTLAGAGSLEAIVLEVGANAWRADVLWRMVDAVRASGAPLIVFLHDPHDHRVGMGALTLALLADASVLGPGTSLRVEESDDASPLTPAGTDAERITRELGGMLWVALRRRGMDPSLSDSLLRGRSSLWIVPDSSGLPRLASEPATPDSPRVIELLPSGGTRGGLDAAKMLSLALVDGEAQDARRALVMLGRSATFIRKVTLRNALSEHREGVLAALDRVDGLLADQTRAFDEVRRPSDDRVVPASAYRRAAGESAERLREIARVLRDAERVLDEHPELLATPAPAGTPVGRTPERNVSDWRGVFLDRRRDLERLEEIARDFARR